MQLAYFLAGQGPDAPEKKRNGNGQSSWFPVGSCLDLCHCDACARLLEHIGQDSSCVYF